MFNQVDNFFEDFYLMFEEIFEIQIGFFCANEIIFLLKIYIRKKTLAFGFFPNKRFVSTEKQEILRDFVFMSCFLRFAKSAENVIDPVPDIFKN